MKPFAKWLAGAAGILAVGYAQASALIDVELINRSSGQPVPAYWNAGEQYVVGVPGERYTVRLSNRSGERVLAVLSVDGVNAVSGETAGFGQAGYVLDPWQTTEVSGWRKSTREVARFYFTRLPDSYAARTGRPDNVGVIGVAAFEERRAPVSLQEGRVAPEGTRATPGPTQGAMDSAAPLPAPPLAAPAPSGSAPSTSAPLARSMVPRMPQEAKSSQPLGTGHGERESSVVELVAFERASTTPAEQHTIWYDSREGLIRRGIIAPPPVPHRPEAFPGQFVPDPACCRY